MYFIFSKFYQIQMIPIFLYSSMKNFWKYVSKYRLNHWHIPKGMYFQLSSTFILAKY